MLAFLLILVALGMELIGSLISIIGVSSIFGQDFLVIALIIALDFAKILSVSFLYQYWEKINFLAKSYLSIAVVILVVATSSGAFGYLSGKVQEAAMPTAEVEISIKKLNDEKLRIIGTRDAQAATKVKLDQQIANLPANQVKGRQLLLASFAPELELIKTSLTTIEARLTAIDLEQATLEQKQLEHQHNRGPIVQMAKSLGISIDSLAKWIILLIVMIFDPLAIALVIAANFMIKIKTTSLTIEVKPVEVEATAEDIVKPIEVVAEDIIKPIEVPPIKVEDIVKPIEDIVNTQASTEEAFKSLTEFQVFLKIDNDAIKEQIIGSAEQPLEQPQFIHPIVSFMDRCVNDPNCPTDLTQQLTHEVNTWWNTKRGSLPLATYLGMTALEYELWLEDPTIFNTLLTARKEGKTIEEILEKTPC